MEAFGRFCKPDIHDIGGNKLCSYSKEMLNVYKNAETYKYREQVDILEHVWETRSFLVRSAIDTNTDMTFAQYVTTLSPQ